MQVHIIEHISDPERIAYAVMAAGAFTLAIRVLLFAGLRIILAMVALAGLALLGGYALSSIGDAGQSVWQYVKSTYPAWQWMADKVFHDGKTILASLLTVPVVWMLLNFMRRD